jgi:hypothetical protein
MNKIVIYVEGGGETVTQKRELRLGFNELFRASSDAARGKKIHLNFVFSGGRDQAYKDFINKVQESDREVLCALLVDSEDPIDAESGDDHANSEARKLHLLKREPWSKLKDHPADRIHLMVQCMETWIVADPEALAKFYGQGFQVKALPVRINLEDEPKKEIYSKLAKATKNTTKGEYGKIKHAAQLLKVVSPTKISSRCARFKTFTKWLTRLIDLA